MKLNAHSFFSILLVLILLNPGWVVGCAAVYIFFFLPFGKLFQGDFFNLGHFLQGFLAGVFSVNVTRKILKSDDLVVLISFSATTLAFFAAITLLYRSTIFGIRFDQVIFEMFTLGGMLAGLYAEVKKLKLKSKSNG
jgi:hypothetical protein